MKDIYDTELFVFNFWCLFEDTVSKLEKIGCFFQSLIRFHPLHPWLQTTKNSFSALQWLLATELQHYFLVKSFEKTMSFRQTELLSSTDKHE